MNEAAALINVIEPLIEQFQPRSVLVAGDLAIACVQTRKDTRFQQITTPYTQQQLAAIQPVELAVISHLCEFQSPEQGQQWLGVIKNLYAPHILLISHPDIAQQQGWQFTDYLAMGFRHIAGTDEGIQVFVYAIENYQPQKDWLNSRFWANPELFDKYRW